MNLLPQDLGKKHCRTIVQYRLGRKQPALVEAEMQPGFWQRRWLRKPREAATSEEAAALQAIRIPAGLWLMLGLLSALGASAAGVTVFGEYIVYPEHIHVPTDMAAEAMELGAAGIWCWFCAVAQPRRLLRHKQRRLYAEPLTAGEIAALLPQAQDTLERSYLTLVMDVARQEITPAAGIDLRGALKSLGDAVDKLPATRVVEGADHDIMTEVLRRTAAETLTAAQAEPDRIVAASLMRRVEALHRRADATARANTLVRRFSVLRQEMAAETEALRAGLTAYYTGAHDISDLTRLAEDIQQVASEAASLTDAVEEVDSVPYAPPVSSQHPAAARIRLG